MAAVGPGGNGNGRGDGRGNPPRRTLGDYTMQEGPKHYSCIVILATEKPVEIKPSFLTLTSAHQFSRKDHEGPYAYLDTFIELVNTMGYDET